MLITSWLAALPNSVLRALSTRRGRRDERGRRLRHPLGGSVIVGRRCERLEERALLSATVIPATGGTSISADTAVGAPGAAYTTLTGPTITEGAPSDVGPAGTLILEAPSGFRFNTSSTPDIKITAGDATAANNINQLAVGSSFNAFAVSASQIAFQINFPSTVTPDTLLFENIQVEPTAGAPLTSGNIVNSSGIINGVSISANLGTLTEVPGAAAKLAFATEPSNTTVGTSISPAVAVNVEDQFGNVLTNDSATPVTLSITAGTGTTGATLSGGGATNDSNGVATFSGVNINRTGTGYTLDATSGLLTKATSTPAFQVAVNPSYTLPAPSVAGAATLSYNSVTGLDEYRDSTNALIASFSPSAVTGLVVNGTATANSLTVDYTNGDPLPSGGLTFNGFNNLGTLNFTGGTFKTETYDYTNGHNGDVKLTNSAGTLTDTITYTGLAPITNTGTAANVVLNLPAGNDQATLQDNGGNVELVSGNGAFEMTTFADPTGSLTINANGTSGSGVVTDTISVNTANLTSALTINGNESFTDVTVAGALGLGANSLSLTGSNIAIDAAATANGGITLTVGSIISENVAAGRLITTGTLSSASGLGTTLGGANSVATYTGSDGSGAGITLENSPTTAAPLILANVTENSGGLVSFTNTNGDIEVAGTVHDDAGVSLNASGAITETTGTINTAFTLTTDSATGTVLNGSNSVATFNATNATSGNVTLTNTALVTTITRISESGGGSVSVTDAGKEIDTTGAVTSTPNGNITLTSSTMSIGAAVTAGGTGAVSLLAAETTISGLISAGSLLSTGSTDFVTGTVITTGVQNYSGIVTFEENTTLSGSTLTFASTVDSGAVASSVTITGNAVFDGPVGSNASLIALAVSGTTDINGGSVLTTGTQTYTGAVTLSAPTTLTTTNSAVLFGSTVDNATATAESLAVVAGTGGTTFTGAVGGGANGAIAALSITGTGNALDDAVFKAAVKAASLNVAGTTDLNGGTVTTTGTQTYTGAVVLSANTVLTTTNSAVLFGSTVDNAAATAESLTVAAGTGGTTFTGALGGGANGAIGALSMTGTGNAADDAVFKAAVSAASVSVTGKSDLNGATVTTSGTQTYTGAVILSTNTTLTTTNSAVLFGSTVDNATATAESLKVAAGTGGATFTGVVGGGADGAIAALSITGTGNAVDDAVFKAAVNAASLNVAGTTDLNGSTVTTTGTQTYTGAVVLSANTVLTTTNSAVLFGSTIDNSTTTAYSLTVAAGTGGTTFTGAVGGGANGAIGALSVTGTGNATIDVVFKAAVSAASVSAAGTVDLNGAQVTTGGAQTYTGAVTLSANTTLSALTAPGTVTFGNTVNGGFSLVVNSPGNEVFDGRVGNLAALASLVTDDPASLITGVPGGQVQFNVVGAAPAVFTVTTTGAQTYNDAVLLQQNTVLSSTAGGTITFENTINGGFNLTANSTGNEVFNGRVGNLAALANLATDNPASLLTGVPAGLTQFNVGGVTPAAFTVTTTGSQTYNDDVQLLNNTVLSSTAAGTITFGKTINGAFGLTLNTAGNEVLNGQVGNAAALASLTTDDPASAMAGVPGGQVQFNVGGAAPTVFTVTTTGAQTYNDAVALLNNTVLSSTAAGTITFESTVNGDFNFTVNSAGNDVFNGRVGNAVALSQLMTDNPASGIAGVPGGQTEFNVAGANATTFTVATTGAQTYNDAVALLQDTVLSSTTAGTITFESTVNGDFNFTVNSAGNEVFNGRVGNTAALASLTTDDPASLIAGVPGGQTQFNVPGANSTTYTVTSTGNQTYNDAVALFQDTVLASTAAGTITFESTVNGAFHLTIDSAGNERFNGPVGNMAALTALTTDDLAAGITGGQVQFNVAGANATTFTVTTTGAQTYNDDVLLLQNAVLSSTAAGTVSFLKTINGAFALTVNSAGNELFQGRIGNAAALASLTTDDPASAIAGVPGAFVQFGVLGASATTFTVTTSGAQTYNDDVQLLQNTVLSSTSAGGANITFGRSINGGFALTVNSTGNEIFNGPVGTTTALLSLTTDDPAALIAGVPAGAAEFNFVGVTPATVTVATVGGQTYNDNVRLLQNTYFNGGGILAFKQAVTGASNLATSSGGTTGSAPSTQFFGNVSVGTGAASLAGAAQDAITLVAGNTTFGVATPITVQLQGDVRIESGMTVSGNAGNTKTLLEYKNTANPTVTSPVVTIASSFVAVTNLQITGGLGTAGDGVAFDNTAERDNVVLTSDWIHGNAQAGVRVGVAGQAVVHSLFYLQSSTIENNQGVNSTTAGVAAVNGGVVLGAVKNARIGGSSGTSNIIDNNVGPGVLVEDSSNNVGEMISQNSIYGNGGMTGVGIELDGQKEDDANSQVIATVSAPFASKLQYNSGNRINDLSAIGTAATQAGPNQLLNTPEINYAYMVSPTLMQVQFSVPVGVVGGVNVEFFLADAEGRQGQTYLGNTLYSRAGQGQGVVDVGVPVALPAGMTTLNPGTMIVATATDVNGDTSEFSRATSINPNPTLIGAANYGYIFTPGAKNPQGNQTVTFQDGGGNVLASGPYGEQPVLNYSWDISGVLWRLATVAYPDSSPATFDSHSLTNDEFGFYYVDGTSTSNSGTGTSTGAAVTGAVKGVAPSLGTAQNPAYAATALAAANIGIVRPFNSSATDTFNAPGPLAGSTTFSTMTTNAPIGFYLVRNASSAFLLTGPAKENGNVLPNGTAPADQLALTDSQVLSGAPVTQNQLPVAARTGIYPNATNAAPNSAFTNIATAFFSFSAANPDRTHNADGTINPNGQPLSHVGQGSDQIIVNSSNPPNPYQATLTTLTNQNRPFLVNSPSQYGNLANGTAGGMQLYLENQYEYPGFDPNNRATWNVESATFQNPVIQIDDLTQKPVSLTVSSPSVSVPITSSPPSTTTVPAGEMLMYRAFDPNNNTHFFTTSLAEFDNALANGWRDETTGQPSFAVYSTQVAGAVPLFRLYDPNAGLHYYTTDANERDSLVNQGWSFEKIEGYLDPAASADGSTEVYRLYNTITGEHLYTAVAGQKDAILAQFPGIWVQNASLGFAFAIDVGTSLPASSAAETAAIQSAPEQAADLSTATVSSTATIVGGAASSLAVNGANSLAPAGSASASLDAPGGTANVVADGSTPLTATTRADSTSGLDSFWTQVSLRLGNSAAGILG